MHTLLLKLSGPLQSWGSASSYRARETESMPTKSGVIGLIASALGRQRNESVDDLAALEFAVRIDQPGHLLRDFQTAIDWKATAQADKNPKLSTRYYLSDAVFTVGLGGAQSVVTQLAEALKRPRYPLFLGRRSCPAGHDLLIDLIKGSPTEALATVAWQASAAHRRTQPSEVFLTVVRDARHDEPGDNIKDIPESFAQEHRKYQWRQVVTDAPVVVHNDTGIDTGERFFSEVAQS